MRTLILALTAAATLVPTLPALAQPGREYREDIRDARRDYRRDVRDADSRRDVREARREYRRDVREARQDRREARRERWQDYNRYDYNRPGPGGRYYADNYYRDGRYYQPRRLSANDRIYRGRNGQYYCRRNDGTTGLLIGALGGGVLGNVIAPGNSDLLGTVLGAAGGGLLGRQIDRNNVRCR